MTLYKSPDVNQVSYGESIGIILLKTVTPALPGDVACALSYSYPVRYKVIPEATIELMFTEPQKILDQFISAGRELQQSGVKAITGDCGFMAALQEEMADALDIPVFMSSLLQVPLIARMLSSEQKIGVITANSRALREEYFQGAGIAAATRNRLAIGGLEDKEHFKKYFLEEAPEVDPELIEQEVRETALKLQQENNLGAFLVECSVLPPYSPAIQEATGLPVFDFITLIDHVHSAVVQTEQVFYNKT